MTRKSLFGSKTPPDDSNIIIDEKTQSVITECGNPEITSGSVCDDATTDATGDQARDLMVLVGKAIEEWAKIYNMDELPKHIIFRQALGIMNAWNNISKRNNK